MPHSLQYEQKIWGRTAPVHVTDQFAIMHLELIANSWCSIHKHLHRHNLFHVLKGSVWVVTYGCEKEPSDSDMSAVKLLADQTITVPAGMWHKFEVADAGEMIETYWPACPNSKVDVEDIVRFTIGGRVEECQSPNLPL